MVQQYLAAHDNRAETAHTQHPVVASPRYEAFSANTGRIPGYITRRV